jgi:tetratricopeptide (TPR) repeat protein
MSMSVLLAILLQVGPAPTIQPTSPIPDEIWEQRRLNREAARQHKEQGNITDNRLANCVALIEVNPEAARADASRWLGTAKLDQKADAAQCQGMALVELGRWEEAAETFINGRDLTTPNAQQSRAQLGAMAGNAQLVLGQTDAALVTLDRAHADAGSAGNEVLKGEIALDRARALVALGREVEARDALTLARLALPSNAQSWLLSATLARRMDALDDAQRFIEQAALLSPTDPEIGLEAGVIAVLSGRDDAARKSWTSVVETAPDTPFAQVAAEYLAQLNPA